MDGRSWLRLAAIDQRKSWRVRIWAMILVISALVLCQLPLFGILGFEFSFVLALLGSVAGADLGASLVRRCRTFPSTRVQRALSPAQTVAQLVAWAALRSMALLVAPLIIVCLNALFVRNCDWLFGLRCFVLMPLLSTALASALGVFSGLAAGNRRWLGLALPHLVLFSTVLVALWHFYRAPAVFSYNILVGYFPGNLYDESIELRAPFYWARLFHLSVVLTLGALSSLMLDVSSLRLCWKPRPTTGRRRPLALAIAAACVASLLWLNSGQLGFFVGSQDIRAALAGRYESEHFVIHYPPIGEIARDIELIADDHEFRRAQLVRDFDVDPDQKILSYFFESPEQKFRLMGARNVYMAKPWRHEIYINSRPFPHPVIRHEIAHVMAGAFADNLFEVSTDRLLGLPLLFNVGMIEGIAVAADWPDHFDKALTPHQSVKALSELGMMPPVENLFSTGFFAFSAARGYTVAGSYIRFLLERYGIERLRILYGNGGDFKTAYGRSQKELTGQWQALIEATPLPPGAAELVRERFRRPALIKRPCPHAIARDYESMAEQVGRGELDRAIVTMRGVCKDAPGEPRHQLQLAAVLIRSEQYKEAASIYTSIGNNEEVSATLRAHALFALVDLLMADENRVSTEVMLQRIAEMVLGADDRRRVRVLRFVLQHKGAAGEELRNIFWAGKPGEPLSPVVIAGRAALAAAAEPTLGISFYLLARQLHGHGAPDATRLAMLAALADDSLGPLVTREAARILAIASYRSGAYDEVLRAARILIDKKQPQVTRLLGYDWMERVTWATTGKVPVPALHP